MNVNLPHEIINDIISYGDVEVTQRFKSVIIQINYHRKMFDIDSKLTPFYFGRLNSYAGISEEEFYLYILDKAYIKQNIYCDRSRFFPLGINT